MAKKDKGGAGDVSEVKPEAPATENTETVKVELDAKIVTELARLREENDELRKKVHETISNGNVTVPVTLTLGCPLVFNGKVCEVYYIDNAWEVGQAVEKSFVNEDDIAFVVRPVKK